MRERREGRRKDIEGEERGERKMRRERREGRRKGVDGGFKKDPSYSREDHTCDKYYIIYLHKKNNILSEHIFIKKYREHISR